MFSRVGSKLIIPYLIVSFFTLLLITGLIYYNYRTEISSIEKIQEEISLKASIETNYYLGNIRKELNLISHNIFCVECKYESNREILKSLMEEDPSIYAISIINREGMEITKIVRHEPKASLDLKDISAQDKFKEAIKGNYYLGDVYISKYDIPFISVSLPIVDENNTKIGVLATEVDLSPMWGTISKIRVEKTGYVYVVDRGGHLIAYKDINLVKKYPDLKDIVGVKNFLNNIHTSETYISFDNEKVMGNWKLIESTGWGLIVELPIKEVYEELLVLFFIAGVSVVMFVSFMIIILLIIFKKLLRPVSYLQKGVMEVKSGNLDYNIDIISKDELGQLASAFNEMTKDLKKSKESLEKYSKELKKKVEERTKELNEKVEELTKTKTSLLNMMEDLDNTNKQLMEAQKELKNNLRELKKLDVDKDRFISIAAHELKTPMTAIHGFAQLLENEKIIKDAKTRNKYLNIIEGEIKRLSKLVTEVLDLSRIDLGTVKFTIEDVDIVKVMEDIKNEMTQKAKEKGLKIDFIIDKNLPIIRTDKEKLKEILINLIDNSIKFTTKGRIKVKTLRKNTDIEFSVSDTGLGIPKESYKKIFSRFYQVELPYTREAGGTGLGLSICKEFVEVLGGKIWFRSKYGKGTTFYFTIPINKSLNHKKNK